MPIGDTRRLIVEVQGRGGETAMAYWTGEFWARAPLSQSPQPIGFEPVRHRLPRPERVAPPKWFPRSAAWLAEVKIILEELISLGGSTEPRSRPSGEPAYRGALHDDPEERLQVAFDEGHSRAAWAAGQRARAAFDMIELAEASDVIT
jgi:hypothetical protein